MLIESVFTLWQKHGPSACTINKYYTTVCVNLVQWSVFKNYLENLLVVWTLNQTAWLAEPEQSSGSTNQSPWFLVYILSKSPTVSGKINASGSVHWPGAYFTNVPKSTRGRNNWFRNSTLANLALLVGIYITIVSWADDSNVLPIE